MEGKGGAKKEEKFSLWNPRPRPECPICMVVMPLNSSMQTYMQCCGKVICSGCVYAHHKVDADGACPFCRHLAPDSDEKIFESIVARVDSCDACAMFHLAKHYDEGDFGLQVDIAKALGLLQRAADLGSIEANLNLGTRYFGGGYGGLPKSNLKARLHWQFAAKNGDPDAHLRLGLFECHVNGNRDLGTRHVRISAQLGDKKAMTFLKEMVILGDINKEELEESEKACDAALEAMRTEERDQHILHLQNVGEHKGSIIDAYCGDLFPQ